MAKILVLLMSVTLFATDKCKMHRGIISDWVNVDTDKEMTYTYKFNKNQKKMLKAKGYKITRSKKHFKLVLGHGEVLKTTDSGFTGATSGEMIMSAYANNEISLIEDKEIVMDSWKMKNFATKKSKDSICSRMNALIESLPNCAEGNLLYPAPIPMPTPSTGTVIQRTIIE